MTWFDVIFDECSIRTVAVMILILAATVIYLIGERSWFLPDLWPGHNFLVAFLIFGAAGVYTFGLVGLVLSVIISALVYYLATVAFLVVKLPDDDETASD